MSSRDNAMPKFENPESAPKTERILEFFDSKRFFIHVTWPPSVKIHLKKQIRIPDAVSCTKWKKTLERG